MDRTENLLDCLFNANSRACKGLGDSDEAGPLARLKIPERWEEQLSHI